MSSRLDIPRILDIMLSRLDMDPLMELHNSVREYRTEQGFTQEELADRGGVTRQTIIAIEKGGYTPSVKLALALAHSLQVPIADLFWLEGSTGTGDGT
jgi:putative transcriptional regulator